MGFRVGLWKRLGGVTIGRSGPRFYFFPSGSGIVAFVALLMAAAIILVALAL